jgi:hypothetical protein
MEGNRRELKADWRAVGTAEEKLARYQEMRDFGATPEPSGAEPLPEHAGLPRFVIQEHHATALHWDLRLERDGVLVSWAVPRGIPPDPKQNHLAVLGAFGLPRDADVVRTFEQGHGRSFTGMVRRDRPGDD